jgi:hypothetical protein
MRTLYKNEAVHTATLQVYCSDSSRRLLERVYVDTVRTSYNHLIAHTKHMSHEVHKIECTGSVDSVRTLLRTHSLSTYMSQEVHIIL